MTVRSVRQAMAAMGLAGQADLSVARDLGGFLRGDAPTDPTTGNQVDVTLGTWFAGLSGPHLHVNIIRVGFDLLGGGLAAEEAAIDYAIHRLRTIYAPVGIGVGRVRYYEVPAAASNGRDDIGDDSEADSLADEWSVPNDGIDCFFVRTITTTDGLLGRSPKPGDCDKGGKSDGMLGGTAGRNDPDGLGRTLAHELGHFLDLSHNHDGPPACPATTTGRNNLMSQTRCAVNTRVSVLLTGSQGSTMRGRCQIHPGK